MCRETIPRTRSNDYMSPNTSRNNVVTAQDDAPEKRMPGSQPMTGRPLGPGVGTAAPRNLD